MFSKTKQGHSSNHIEFETPQSHHITQMKLNQIKSNLLHPEETFTDH